VRKQGMIILLCAVLFALNAAAIITGNNGVAETAPSGDWGVDWSNVYEYKNCSSVAVDDYWILTAAHVADDPGSGTLTIGSTDYLQQEIVYHPSADLALVRFDKTFPGHYPLYTGTFPTATWPKDRRLSAVMIGCGVTGTVYSTYYTARAWNDSPNGSGIKRWGSNKIDGPHNGVNYDVGGTTGMTYNDGIQILFTLSGTTYEAGVGVYDSGGGTFVKDGGIWKLAGINTIRYGTAPNYTGTFAISIPFYETWATNVMNEVGDLDGDGIPNYWEQQFGATTGVVASADDDGDGPTGYDEWIADTDPTDSNAFFNATGTLTLTNQTFTFTGSTGRQYQVFYTTNDLADAGLTWTAHGIPTWGEGAGTEIVVTNLDDTVFYRVWVTLP